MAPPLSIKFCIECHPRRHHNREHHLQIPAVAYLEPFHRQVVSEGCVAFLQSLGVADINHIDQAIRPSKELAPMLPLLAANFDHNELRGWVFSDQSTLHVYTLGCFIIT